MRLALITCLLLTSPAAFTHLEARDGADGTRLRVFVTATPSPSGFVDNGTREREDAVRDLRESILKKRRALQLVERAEDADIRLEVAGRYFEDSGARQSTSFGSGGIDAKGQNVYTAGSGFSRVVKNYVLRADLVVGSYREPLAGVVPDTYILGGPWRTAAHQITDSLEKFATNNRERLLQARAH